MLERPAAGISRGFFASKSGSIGVIAALSMPMLIGGAVLGAEVGVWAYKRQTMQGAADAAAISGVVSGLSGSSLTVQGRGVAASQGYVDGSNGATVQINSPPLSGPNASTPGAVEAIIRQPQQPVLAKIFSSSSIVIGARSVAIPNPGGTCMLALSGTANGAITLQGTAQVKLTGCSGFSNSSSSTSVVAGGSSNLSLTSLTVVGAVGNTSNITATGGIKTVPTPLLDPYAGQSYPAYGACSQSYSSGNATLYPGVYCGGLSLTAGASVTLSPGIYYLDGGSLSMAGNASLSGTGVTIVFTSSTGSNYANASISSNAVVNLTAPTTGPTAGIVLFGDRSMPEDPKTGLPTVSFQLKGGGTQNWGGAIYLPKAALTYAGGATGGSGCTQIVTDTVTFTGNSNMSLNCAGYGIKPIGTQLAALAE